MVEILLATYNGEKYLREQLDSILAQTYKDFFITVRDDGSTDGTKDILNEYAENYPEKFRMINTKSDENFNSARNNFAILLQEAKGDDHFCLCCQDDVWMPDKLSKQMALMDAMEKKYGSGIPLLVHSDMEIVDENLQPLEKSYVKYANIQPEGFSLKKMLAENCTVGITCLFDTSLLAICRDIPDEAVSPEWWLGLHAAALGKIGYIDEPLVKYRQHPGSISGAVSGRFFDIIKNGKFRNSKFDTQKSYYQAEAFLNANAKLLNAEKTKIIAKYASFISAGKFTKVMAALFGGYAKNSLLASIIQAANS